MYTNDAKVQQRGVQGAVAILQQCIQGVSLVEGAKVNVFDLTPNRFAEWSRAVWDLQLKHLNSTDTSGPAFTYTGYFTDIEEASQQRKSMHGRAMSDSLADVC